MGATWWFASPEHRDRFAGEPQRYAPQLGGYCAWAVSQAYNAGIDPTAWKIVEGKLYRQSKLAWAPQMTAINAAARVAALV